MPSYSRVIKSEETVIKKNARPSGPAVLGLSPQDNQEVMEGEGNDREKRVEQDNSRDREMKEAYQNGFAEGRKQERERAADQVSRLLAIGEELSSRKGRLIQEAELEILRLALALAGKVLQREVTTNRDYLEALLKGTVASLVNRESIKIRVNPDDYSYLTEVRPDIPAGLPGVRNWEIMADASVRAGGVIVETDSGDVDARIDKQMEVLEKELSALVEK